MKPLLGTELKRFLRNYKRQHPLRHNLVFLLQSVEYPANVGSAFRVADGVGEAEQADRAGLGSHIALGGPRRDRPVLGDCRGIEIKIAEF